MMTERQRLLYVSEKKSWVVALLATALFGPFGLFYSKYVAVSLFLTLAFCLEIFGMIAAAVSANVEGFVGRMIMFILLWIVSLILAPILVSFYNKN